MKHNHVQITKNPTIDNEWKLVIEGVTGGKLLAIYNALREYREKSPVGNDMFCMLRNHIERDPVAKVLIMPYVEPAKG